MAAENPKEELPPPRTEDEWLDATYAFAEAVVKRRRYNSGMTRVRIATAVDHMVRRVNYYSGYVTLSSSLDEIYISVQPHAVAGLMERLEQARTAAIRAIDVRDIPDQVMKEVAIRFHPMPSN